MSNIKEKQVTGMEGERKKRGMSVADFYAILRDPPSASSLPIFDAVHTRNAMARFNQTKFKNPAERSKAHTKIMRVAKKFGIDVSNFKKIGSSNSSSQGETQEVNKLNYRRLNMEKDEETTQSSENQVSESNEVGESNDVVEMKNNITFMEKTISEISKQMKAHTDIISQTLAELKSLKEADVDETPEEESEESKSEDEETEKVEEPVKSEEVSEPKETEDSDDDSEEEEATEESTDVKVGKSDYKIVQRYKSFTVEKSKYR